MAILIYWIYLYIYEVPNIYILRNFYNKTVVPITKTLRAYRINMAIIFCILSVDIHIHIQIYNRLPITTSTVLVIHTYYKGRRG